MEIAFVNESAEVRDGLSVEQLLDSVRQCREKSERFWADVASPSQEEMGRIAEGFGLHPLTADDCLNRLVPVKWQEFDDHLYVVAHGLNFNEGAELLETENLSILVFADGCLSVHAQPLRTPRRLLDRMRRRKLTVLPEPDRVLHLLLDTIVHFYAGLAEEVTDEVDEIDEEIVAGGGDGELPQRVRSACERLAVLRRRLTPLRNLLREFCTEEVPFIQPETQAFFHDVLDAVVRLLEKAEVTREMLNAAQANHLAYLAHQTNEIMKILSLVATIVLPLSFLTGLFGMNVHVPGQGGQGLIWFVGLACFMAVAAGGLLLYFHRRGWL